uniref:FERM domain-containing protein n=1 Tax=Eptatretus burgeri TaxID=7764 RepID=A0A8C4QEF9_EPTBU
MRNHLNKYKLIKGSPHGCTKGSSCLTNLLEFYEAVSDWVDEEKAVDIVYLDFKKAFDKVPHRRLLAKVRACGVVGQVANWIANWLSDRKQGVAVGGRMSFRLFPEDVNEELIMDITQKFFFLQMLESITKDEIFCSAETCVLLASYASQELVCPLPFWSLALVFFCPRVLSQYSLTKEQWAQRVSNWHRELSRYVTVLEYLRLCQDLEMFGVAYFSIKNRRGTNLWLGIDARGLNIYEQDNKLTPKIGFPWKEIKLINYRDKKLIIKPRDQKAPDFVCFATQVWVNKQILELCSGNQQLHLKRHSSDSAEVQQMKVEAKENQTAREAERTRLKKERQRRAEAEEEKKRIETERLELEQRLKEIEQETERTKRELEEEARRAKKLQLESERAREESRRLEEEKRRAERQCSELELIAEERKKGKEELVMVGGWRNIDIPSVKSFKQQRESQMFMINHVFKLLKIQVTFALGVRSWQYPFGIFIFFPPFSKYSINGAEEAFEREEKTWREEQLEMEDLQINGEEETRLTEVEKNERIRQQLLALSAELALSRDTSRLTKLDNAHEDALQKGQDKYKTLRRIRQGNTRQRVDEFESL